MSQNSNNDSSLAIHVVYSIPSPYQEQLFECIAHRDDIELHVSYRDERAADRDWVVDIGDYNYDVMDGITLFGRQINPGIVRKLQRDNPDVLVIGGYAHPTMQLATVTAWTLGIPVVLWCESHGLDWRNRRPDLRTRVKDVLLSVLVRGCGAFLAPGRLQLQYLEAHGADPDDVFIGTHTCDIAAFRDGAADADPEVTRREYGITEDVVLTYVGRLIEEKGLPELVDAAASVSGSHDDVAFVLAGTGPLKEDLRQQIRKHGLDNMYLPGFVPRNELPALYGASDVFIFPSRGDPWGVVVNEAMACGLPVVTTQSVGAGYDLVVDGVNGAIVPPNDSTALASAIERVLEAGPDRLGRRSEQIIYEWTHDDAADSTVDAAVRAAR